MHVSFHMQWCPRNILCTFQAKYCQIVVCVFFPLSMYGMLHFFQTTGTQGSTSPAALPESCSRFHTAGHFFITPIPVPTPLSLRTPATLLFMIGVWDLGLGHHRQSTSRRSPPFSRDMGCHGYRVQGISGQRVAGNEGVNPHLHAR